MLTVCLNWIYITFISFPIGFLILSIIGKKFSYQYNNFRVSLWAGLVFDTVYAQFFSLFGRVGLIANILLTMLALACWALSFKKLKEQAISFYQEWKREKKWFRIAKPALLVMGIALTAYGTSRGYMAYDTALYHAQAIRWIEEYGVVKGLGLLHNRFAYNSASFALSALFSFSFLPGVRLHCISGYFLMLLSMEIPDLLLVFRRKHFLCSDFILVGIFYYYTLAFGQVVAPASDFPATIVVFYLVLRFVKLIEEKEENTTPYSLLCVLAVFGVTLKLSVGLLVLLTVYPVYLMVRRREGIRIPFYLSLGFLVALPFLVRGVLISGYLLYPQTLLDIFPVDWKIPAESARADMLEIQRWGRNLQFEAREMNSLKEWVPGWFMSQDAMVKIMLALDAMGMPAVLAYALIEGLVKKHKEILPCLFLWLVLYLSAGYWFISAPLVRYGYAYVILPFLVSFGLILSGWKKIFPIVGIGMLLFLGYKILALGKNAYAQYRLPYYFSQQAYEEYDTVSYQVDGYTFYLPVNGDQTGYECFPAAPYPFGGRLRGTDLKDGFKRESQ